MAGILLRFSEGGRGIDAEATSADDDRGGSPWRRGPVDVKQYCPSGNATVRNDVTALNGLIGILIGIIYYPTTVEVWCADSGTPVRGG
jgi:Bor protein